MIEICLLRFSHDLDDIGRTNNGFNGKTKNVINKSINSFRRKLKNVNLHRKSAKNESLKESTQVKNMRMVI